MKETRSIYTPKQIRQLEISEGIFKLTEINYFIFQKTLKEKARLQTIKLAHKNKLKRAGVDPKKQMNLRGETIKYLKKSQYLNPKTKP